MAAVRRLRTFGVRWARTGGVLTPGLRLGSFLGLSMPMRTGVRGCARPVLRRLFGVEGRERTGIDCVCRDEPSYE